ncbi:hypothetical protein KC365_g8850 [Hortaea werneckii]|nr:hypothetical protein KC365_g8850 [Hortaea werneckii]
MVSSIEGPLYPDIYRPSNRGSSNRSGSSIKGHRTRGSLIQFCSEYARHGECKFYDRDGRCEFAHELPNRNVIYTHFPDQLTYPPPWYCRKRMAKEACACSPPSEPRINTELEGVASSAVDCRSKSDRPSVSMPHVIPDESISDETLTRAGLDTPKSPPPESPQVKTLEQAWLEKQDEWLPKLLWTAELRINGDTDQLKSAQDWHTEVLMKLSKVAELTPGDPASAHQYLREASQHHAVPRDEEPNVAGISVHKLLEVLKRARRLAATAASSKPSTIASDLGQKRTARTRRAIGSPTCKGLQCIDVDDDEPPMLPPQGFKRELSGGSQESIVVTGAGPHKRLRADPQPGPQPEPQLEVQLEPPTTTSDRTRIELEEAIGAAGLAAARFDMLEKKDRVQRLKLQLSS